jgi:hypothetical protein
LIYGGNIGYDLTTGLPNASITDTLTQFIGFISEYSDPTLFPTIILGVAYSFNLACINGILFFPPSISTGLTNRSFVQLFKNKSALSL